jgi:hypothetical protein
VTVLMFYRIWASSSQLPSSGVANPWISAASAGVLQTSKKI